MFAPHALFCCATAALLAAALGLPKSMPREKEHVNSIGMRLVRIEPGSFLMGFQGNPVAVETPSLAWRATGDVDEQPAHRVTIATAFYMGAHEVTNAEYERFDAGHRALR